MVALISLFMIVLLSITAVRIGAIALELTGLSPDVASFQAQSAFSGAGFTTSESETIVTHPLRRKIIRILILFGSAGITSTIATFVITFIGPSKESIAFRALFLLGGLLVIYLFVRSKIIYNLMKKVIVKALNLSKELRLYDYHEILGLSKGYSISRILINEESWIAGKQLKDVHLQREGTLVLSIHRTTDEGEKFMVPSGETTVQSGDKLTVYGQCASCQCLAERPKGDRGDHAHEKRVEQEDLRATVREKNEGFVEI